MPKPETIAKNILTMTRESGWSRVVLEMKPDGTIRVEGSTVEAESDDDFMSSDLRMGR